MILLAAKFGVPVCPHAGGVGLCELVQHLSMFDYIAVSGRMDDRIAEFVDHLHEHFVDPVVIRRAATCRPTAPRLQQRNQSRVASANSGTRTVRYGTAFQRRPDMRRYVPLNRVPHDGTGDRVRADRDVQLALVDRDAECHAPLEPRRKRGDQQTVERIQLERLGAVNPLTLQVSDHLADVLVRIDRDTRRQLGRLVQPGGVRRTDVDPGAKRAGQVADRDRGFVGSDIPRENSMPSVNSIA